MRWLYTFLFVCAGMCVTVVMIYAPKSNAKQDEDNTPHEHREFSFDYSNVTDETVWINSVRVLNRQVNLHRVWAKSDRGGGISYRRNDCTPEALLSTRADFEWWKMDDPMGSKAARSRPKDLKKVFRCSTLFPWFDAEADGWRCVYTLQHDKTWVGWFEGVVLKPIGAKPESLKKSQVEGNNQWIQFQFLNLTDNEICFLIDGKLVNAANEVRLHIPNVPANETFHGFTAHSHPGSTFRPESGARIEFAWCVPAYKLKPGETGKTRTQTIKLPDFDPEVDNWYCYFTLSPKGIWSTAFEGTVR